MTDEERQREGAEEPIEDLEAPAEAQADVVGGLGCTPSPTCGRPSAVCGQSAPQSCEITQAFCQLKSRKIVIMAQ
jgi:hypothetical protein